MSARRATVTVWLTYVNRRISLRQHDRRRQQLTWQGSTLLTPEEQRKRKMRTLKLQLDYVLARNIPQSDIRKSRTVWDVDFDSNHRPVLLSFIIRFQKRSREVPLQPKIDMGRSGERRRMQNKIPPTCVYSCWSTDQKEA
ncbi:hypothetical protein RB195_024024 [Necator americanus]|uniref:Endonuclease/exonuclease/phosphatase domain-containing protein n=1 Tax=Necator americanus TaxID=51031 RepID=A0ABR1ELI8_NECAM